MKDLTGRIFIRAYKSPKSLARFARADALEVINSDADLSALRPYEHVNYTGAAFTQNGVYVVRVENEHDMYLLGEDR